MNYNKETQEVNCHICNKWIDIRTNTYIVDTQVRCLECDAVLGYKKDLPEIFGQEEE